mmetsp:Transcript_118719/g.236466  ORF Transcript_118719/g.236466 Transcript_118719/m.236466 type:complete len:90 (+) Transcript_118719:75-344(+)|eukprot:CAMPEP_0172672918 /NCGR_PEP_ID=MMETSP1074-20121228/11838_1 /TAXON_ID=2916 /ORGANISM="Ceratium fusus, Strain PA161109" /LENGTH=89 /DNA_ID=CAMNT_0013490165 /DNA_START=74 /DNA_END=343 /DNA_ORIENTATION=+
MAHLLKKVDASNTGPKGGMCADHMHQGAKALKAQHAQALKDALANAETTNTTETLQALQTAINAAKAANMKRDMRELVAAEDALAALST